MSDNRTLRDFAKRVEDIRLELLFEGKDEPWELLEGDHDAMIALQHMEIAYWTLLKVHDARVEAQKKKQSEKTNVEPK